MVLLAVIAALFGVGALITFVGVRLIESAHPPRGRFVEIGGLRQHVVELAPTDGDGSNAPPVVLLHGAGCNLEDMHLALAERCAGRWRTIMVDRPGHGWSERAGRASSSPAEQAAMLCDLFDRLAVDRAIVVGHSWGGALAATFALDYPQRVAGLLLLAPPVLPRLRRLTLLNRALSMPIGGWLFAHTLALPLAAMAFGGGVRSAFLPQLPPKHYLQRSAAFLLLRPAAFLANARDLARIERFLARQMARYQALAAPTIIVSGDQDRTLAVQEHALALAAAVPAAKLMLLEGTGHMVHHAAADRVVAAIEELAANGR